MSGIVSINITIVNRSIRQARLHFKDEWFKELKIDKSRRVLIIYNNKENLEEIAEWEMWGWINDKVRRNLQNQNRKWNKKRES